MVTDPSALEPLITPAGDGALDDLVLELVHQAAELNGQLNGAVRNELARLVRSMNCYYSNFIEGHETHPRDIDSALHNEFQLDPRQRDLQIEARAHIDLQRAVDAGSNTPNAWPASDAYVRWLHREFYERLPKTFLKQTHAETGRESLVVPGQYRTEHVAVGRHVPPAPAALSAFMLRFEEAYSSPVLSKSQRIISVAAAHHRLLWIHPFLDGNGRVARLMSHAMLLQLGVGSSLWSVARGLARNVVEYKASLTYADAQRRNDLDGRGPLSLEGLKHFCKFFLTTCIDQVRFMRRLFQPAEMLRRIEIYTSEEILAKRLPKGSFEMLREAYYHGEVPRGRAPEITGYEERRARETVSVLLEKGLLLSPNHRAPVSLGFPQAVLERWLPNLYPTSGVRE
jgi:Fic family protein